jgi:hypothetical protein
MTTQQNKELGEAITVGGGETGQSKVPDPHGGKATLPKSNNNSESMPKIAGGTPGQGVEETDTESNVKVTGDTSASNRASVSMKEDVEAMLSGENLSEEFKEKATIIFEAAVAARLAALSEQLEAEFQTKLAEQTAASEAALAEKVNEYLDYVVGQWMQENRVAIEHSLRTEITEGFIADLKSLFEQHNISIPDESLDALAATQEQVDEVQARLDEALRANMELTTALNEAARKQIIGEMSEGLAATQAEKLVTLAEGVVFESADSYRKKLSVVKETYFPADKPASTVQHLLEEVQEVEGEKQAVPTNSNVAQYVSAISRTVKK